MTNVLIVENERIVQEMLSTYVASAPDRYSLVGIIADAANTEVVCLRSQVDLILMDVCTENDESGIDATAVIKKRHPNIKVIIVTSAPEVTFLHKARLAKADSFYYKNISEQKLLDVMDRTMRDECIWPDETPPVQIGNTMSTEFTSTELKVLRYLTDGYSITEIAKMMGVKESTTRYHVDNLKDKIGVKTITGVVRMVTKKQLILPEF